MVKKYLSLVKFSHTIFAMPFAIIGYVLGYRKLESATDFWSWHLSIGGSSPAVKLLLVIMCMVFARSAAMAFNRYLDRHFDALNPRTAIREIPAGILKAESVWWFTVINSLLFMLACLFINPLCFYLSPVALAVVLGYSYTKRFTPLCHLVLGVGLSLAPIGAYLAVAGQFSWIPILFSLTVIGWVSGFDIIYSLQDEEFDRSQKLYSIPAALGKSGALRISELLHVCAAVLVVWAGLLGGFGIFYWAGVVLFSGMLVYQHAIVKPHDLRRVNLAFMTANGLASVVFAFFVVLDRMMF